MTREELVEFAYDRGVCARKADRERLTNLYVSITNEALSLKAAGCLRNLLNLSVEALERVDALEHLLHATRKALDQTQSFGVDAIVAMNAVSKVVSEFRSSQA